MKKVLLSLMLLMAGMAGNAQVITLTDGGVYEKKEVINVDGVKASELFLRAMEALSDWTGPDGRSKAGIDYQDKESGTIIYKGNYYMGFRHVILRAGWDMCAHGDSPPVHLIYASTTGFPCLSCHSITYFSRCKCTKNLSTHQAKEQKVHTGTVPLCTHWQSKKGTKRTDPFSIKTIGETFAYLSIFCNFGFAELTMHSEKFK